MTTHNIFAIISDGIIKNLCVGDYEATNYIAKAAYGQEAFAVEATRYPVSEGDLYKDGSFYKVDVETKAETLVNPNPSEEDEIAKLKAELKTANETLSVYDAAIADLGAAVSAQNTGGKA